MAKSKRVAHLVQVVSGIDRSPDESERTFYAVLTENAEEALRQIQELCGENEEDSLAHGFLSAATARALRLTPDEPRRL